MKAEDAPFFEAVTRLLSMADHNRRGASAMEIDEWGFMHLILFGDFKQSRPQPHKFARLQSVCWQHPVHGFLLRLLQVASSHQPYSEGDTGE